MIDLNAADAPAVTAADSARLAVDRRERAIYDSLRTLGPSTLTERDVLWMELYDTRQRNRAMEREAEQRSIREAQRDRAIQNTSNAFSAYLMGSLLVGLGSLLFLLTL